MTKGEVAKLAHEANRMYCQTIGDGSVLPWQETSDEHKAMLIEGVESIRLNPDQTPEQGHEKWLEARKKDGWRWGPVKDEVRKEHPCMVPYSQLPITQRFKDYLFRSVVLAALEMD